MKVNKREMEVLRLSCEALSNKMIANRLSITESTVKKHKRNLFLKLKVFNSVGAFRVALSEGWVPVPERKTI